MVAKGIRVILKTPILSNGGCCRAKKTSGRNRTDDRRFTNTRLAIYPQFEARTTVFQLPMTRSFYVSEEPNQKKLYRNSRKIQYNMSGRKRKRTPFYLHPPTHSLAKRSKIVEGLFYSFNCNLNVFARMSKGDKGCFKLRGRPVNAFF